MRDSVCWWNFQLNMPDYLYAGLLKHVWPFVPHDTKGLREGIICETKNCEIKVCEMNLEKWRKLWKDCKWADFCCIYLFLYGLLVLT